MLRHARVEQLVDVQQVVVAAGANTEVEIVIDRGPSAGPGRVLADVDVVVLVSCVRGQVMEHRGPEPESRQ